MSLLSFTIGLKVFSGNMHTPYCIALFRVTTFHAMLEISIYNFVTTNKSYFNRAFKMQITDIFLLVIFFFLFTSIVIY